MYSMMLKGLMVEPRTVNMVLIYNTSQDAGGCTWEGPGSYFDGIYSRILSILRPYRMTVFVKG